MTKTSETAKPLPAYRIYSVVNEEGKDAVWCEIGSAWANADGKGLNLYFKALALPGAQLVLREPKVEDQA